MNTDKLKSLIRSLIREEVSFILKPVLKEAIKPLLSKSAIRKMVKECVNEALADKFVSTLNEENLTKVMAPEVKKSPPPTIKRSQNNPLNEMKKELIGNDPMAELIYSDITTDQLAKAGGQMSGADDDPGVDLSKFGM